MLTQVVVARERISLVCGIGSAIVSDKSIYPAGFAVTVFVFGYSRLASR
jgi:hypothetical protein